MPAPCCLRWAGTLTRPPESSSPKKWCPLTRRSLGVLLKFLTCVFVIMLTVPLVIGDECALRKRVPMDGPSRALLAPQVVEAVVQKVTKGYPLYEVMFLVTRVYKKYRGHGRVKKHHKVSLPFRKQPSSLREYHHLTTVATTADCVAVADLVVNRKYFLFLNGAEQKRALLQNIFPPIPSTKRTKRRIKNIVCSGCAKAPSVSRLRDDSVVRGHTANLTCTFDGSPAPTVTWLKDGKVINQRTSPTTNIRIYTRRIRIKPRTRRPRRRRRRRDSRHSNRKSTKDKTKRKKSKRKKMSRGKARLIRVISTLSLRNSSDSDKGLYSCVGKSVLGEASAKAALSVVKPLDPGMVFPCPYDSYCLNGGTCMFFKHFGEFVCQCAEGYKGQRCQEKEVFPTFQGHNCRSSLPYLSSSRGLRCPRNQPVFLWEILQQSLAAHRQKVSPWTKPHHLSWSPSRTLKVYPWAPPHPDVPFPTAPQNSNFLFNTSALSFLIPPGGYRSKEQAKFIPLGPVLPIPGGINQSQEMNHDFDPSEESKPILMNYLDSVLNNSRNNPQSLDISSSTSPVSTSIPKSLSGHNKVYGDNSKPLEGNVYAKAEKSFRHHHNGLRLRRIKHNPTSKWPFQTHSQGQTNLELRQSYVYPTSLTSTTNVSSKLS